jgi:hypothetical protein
MSNGHKRFRGSRAKILIFRNAGADAGHILAKRASIYRHESGSRRRDNSGGSFMRAQRVCKPVGPVRKNAEIDRLYLELASFNERIQELEKQNPEASKIEALRVSALALARQIDEICWSSANDLTDLLSK